MLSIQLDSLELYDSENDITITTKPMLIKLEHSLISIAKWESIHEKPYLSLPHDDPKTPEEMMSYLNCMVVGKVPEWALLALWNYYGKDIEDYIHAANTATKVQIGRSKAQAPNTYVTSEVIYAWMIERSVPWQAEKWHINRLLTLIKVINVRNSDEKKPRRQAMQDRRALNAQRLANMRKGK